MLTCGWQAQAGPAEVAVLAELVANNARLTVRQRSRRTWTLSACGSVSLCA